MRVALMVAMAVWGINLSAVKVLTTTLDIMVVACSRMMVAVVALTAIVLVTRQIRIRLRPSIWLGLVGCGALMVYGNQILFAAALSRTSATNGALIQALGPLVSSVIAAVALRESLGLKRLAGLVVGLGGVVMVILSRAGALSSEAGMGDLLMLASVTCFAAGGAMVQRLSAGLSAIQLSWVVHVVGTTLLLAHTGLTSLPAVDDLWRAQLDSWGLILFSGIGATALAALAWNRAIARIGIAQTSAAIYWVPVFGLAFAVLALQEPVTVWHLGGIAAVFVGSRLISSARQAQATSRSGRT